MLNKISPKADPGGTPFVSTEERLKDILIFVLCHRTCNYESILSHLLRIAGV